MKTLLRARGYVSLLAVVFIALGALMATYVYAMVSSSSNIAHNQDMSRQAMLAAESGLDYLNVVLPQITKDANIVTTANAAEPLLVAAQPILNQSAQISGAPAVAVAENLAHTVGTLTIAPVTLYTPDPSHGLYGTASFSATISNQFLPYLRDPTISSVVEPVLPEYCVTVTGSYSRNGVTVTRTIGMNADAVSMAHYSESGYGIIAKGNISLPPSANGGVFLYDYSFDPPALNQGRKGAAYSVQNGELVSFDGSAPPSSSEITWNTYPADLYTKLQSFDWTTSYVNPPDGSSATWTNVKIPKHTNLTVTGNVTINGVLYMEYPSSITFGGSSTKDQTITINGAIIWEQSNGQGVQDETLTFGRYVGVDTGNVATRDAQLQTVLGPDATHTLLNGDIIAAPQTNLVLDPGNTVTGILKFNGGVHVNNVTGSGTGNVLNKAPTTGAMVIDGGTLTAEGSVDLRGNTAFCVNPPAGSTLLLDPDRFRLAFNPRTYWEPQ